jgi:hypothetical protein
MRVCEGRGRVHVLMRSGSRAETERASVGVVMGCSGRGLVVVLMWATSRAPRSTRESPCTLRRNWRGCAQRLQVGAVSSAEQCSAV